MKDFDKEFTRIECVTPGREFYTDRLVNPEGQKIKDFIVSSHDRLLRKVIEMVEGIDDSGGGSGRRMKVQLLSLLKASLNEAK